MKTIIVAEIGSNWEGSISIAKKIIKECKKSGADCVKFQMWRAEDLYSKEIPEWKNIKKSELTFKKAKIIKKYSDSIGIEFFCSPFYPEAVDFLESLNVKKYKIASRTSVKKDFNSEITLNQIAKTKQPVIISMGMGGNRVKMTEIFSKNKDLVYCYCITDYPTPFEKINWKEAVKYNGFSDHSLGIIAPIIYSTLKKKQKSKKIIIEKHVKLENSKGPDAETSITVGELKKMTYYLRKIEKTSL